MMPYRLVLNWTISSGRSSAMKAYDEWSNTTTSAAMPRNASNQPNRDVWARVPDAAGALPGGGRTGWVVSILILKIDPRRCSDDTHPPPTCLDSPSDGAWDRG